MNRADVRKSQDEVVERPDVVIPREELDHYERIATQYAGWGSSVQMSAPYMLKIFAYIRFLEARQ